MRPRWSSKPRAWRPQLRRWCRVLDLLFLISGARPSTRRRRPPNKDQGREADPRTSCSSGGAVTQCMVGSITGPGRAAQAGVDTGINDGSRGHHPHRRLTIRYGRCPPFCTAPAAVLLGRRPWPSRLRALRGQAWGPSLASGMGAPCCADKPARLQGASAPQVVHCDRGDNTAVLEATLRLSSGKPP